MLPAILFHAGFPAFGGGYVGVDVFFALSFYLITRILSGEMEAGRFSLIGHLYGPVVRGDCLTVRDKDHWSTCCEDLIGKAIGQGILLPPR